MKAFEIDRHSFIFDDNNEHRKRAILDMNGDIKHIFSNNLMMHSIQRSRYYELGSNFRIWWCIFVNMFFFVDFHDIFNSFEWIELNWIFVIAASSGIFQHTLIGLIGNQQL